MAYGIRVSVRKAPAGFDTGKVCRLSVPLLDGPGRAVEQGGLHLLPAQADPASRADPRRDLVKEGEDQLLQPWPHLLLCQLRPKQSDPAVDVVADGTGRYDAIPDVGGHHPTDRQAVPLMNVRHGEGGLDDPRQE